MANKKENLELGEILSNIKLEDFMKTVLEKALNEIISRELSLEIKADNYERNVERVNYRNGHRVRQLITSLGKLAIEIPKVRKGNYYPSILEKYQRIDRALLYVVQEAYINGVATRKMKKLFSDLEISGLSKSTVSRIIKPVMETASQWNNRELNSEYVYVWLDGIRIKIRESGTVFEESVLIATGLQKDGHRTVLGFYIHNRESYYGWQYFLLKLKKRGLKYSGLWIRDQHEGLSKSLSEIYSGQLQQRCIVHWQRNFLDKLNSKEKGKYGKKISEFVTSSTIDQFKNSRKELLTMFYNHKIYDWLEETFPEISNFTIYPESHWRKIKSTNPIERLNNDIRRRERSIRIFPTETSCEILIGAILSEKSEEWETGNIYIGKEITVAIKTMDTIKNGKKLSDDNNSIKNNNQNQGIGEKVA